MNIARVYSLVVSDDLGEHEDYRNTVIRSGGHREKENVTEKGNNVQYRLGNPPGPRVMPLADAPAFHGGRASRGYYLRGLARESLSRRLCPGD